MGEIKAEASCFGAWGGVSPAGRVRLSPVVSPSPPPAPAALPSPGRAAGAGHGCNVLVEPPDKALPILLGVN